MMKKYLSLQKIIDQKLELFFNGKIKAAKNLSPFLVSNIKEKRNFVMNGGKRLRPILLYYGYIAAGGKNKKAIMDACIFIELIHGYLLIHDDIIDQDDQRRGMATLHRQYEALYKKLARQSGHLGVSLAIVAGDMLSTYGYDILGRSSFPDAQKIKALAELNSILSDATTGQTLDILYSTNATVELKDILKVFEYKTAKYTIEGPLRLGAILAGANQKMINLLSRYALPLGIAFQIQDDILGMFGNKKKTGKAIDSDIKQNKKTLLILQAKKLASVAQKKTLAQALGNQHLKNAQVEAVRNIIKETKSLEYSQRLSEKLVNQSKQSIEKSNLSREVKAFLIELANYIISREK
ncbi:MAG: polyprenyl synthetase family protein [Candidatus Staskawiczbacteria bacterium]|nr:polyprenyl synthetase family protein [Candidatus Staskawiczbacteria bacterium]